MDELSRRYLSRIEEKYKTADESKRRDIIIGYILGITWQKTR